MNKDLEKINDIKELKRLYLELNEELEETEKRVDSEVNNHIMSDKNYCQVINDLTSRISKAIEYINKLPVSININNQTLVAIATIEKLLKGVDKE